MPAPTITVPLCHQPSIVIAWVGHTSAASSTFARRSSPTSSCELHELAVVVELEDLRGREDALAVVLADVAVDDDPDHFCVLHERGVAGRLDGVRMPRNSQSPPSAVETTSSL